jgi:type I restriction enzyme M protein
MPRRRGETDGSGGKENSAMNAQNLVAKVWNFAHVLRDQGVSYQAYISQISYLLFLKMDEERVEQIGEASMLPEGARWSDIKDLTGEALAQRYTRLLETLSRRSGIIGAIFLKAQSEIQDPAKLRRLVGLIDGETWLGLPVDVKGAIYEDLLARNAEDVKSGAGQYFTPRPLIEAMVALVDPEPQQTVHDPARGTAGFLLAAWEHMKQHPRARDRAIYSALKNKFSGIDIVPEVVRLAAMNLYLHGITGVDSIVEAKDALLGAGGRTYDVILTNPPFGKKQSYRIIRDDGEIDSEREDYDRSDFFVTTSDKQLNFLQHIMTVLAPDGEAAVVLPDNVLFEGGAGEAIRRRLLNNFDFHTLLRLPTGIFYKQGVKANVLFFDKKPPSEDTATTALWIYDLRTNQRFTLKERPMVRADLDDFVACYRSGRRSERVESERFKRFPIEALLGRDKLNLDIFWLKDDAHDDPDLLPPPDEVAAEIVESLATALERFRGVARALAGRG